MKLLQIYYEKASIICRAVNFKKNLPGNKYRENKIEIFRIKNFENRNSRNYFLISRRFIAREKYFENLYFSNKKV